MRKVTITLKDGTKQIIQVSDKCNLSDSEIEKGLFGNEMVCFCNDNCTWINNRFK